MPWDTGGASSLFPACPGMAVPASPLSMPWGVASVSLPSMPWKAALALSSQHARGWLWPCPPSMTWGGSSSQFSQHLLGVLALPSQHALGRRPASLPVDPCPLRATPLHRPLLLPFKLNFFFFLNFFSGGVTPHITDEFCVLSSSACSVDASVCCWLL